MVFWNCIRKYSVKGNLRLGGKIVALFLVVLVPARRGSAKTTTRVTARTTFIQYSSKSSKSSKSSALFRRPQAIVAYLARLLIFPPTTSALLSLLLLSATLLCLSLGRRLFFLKRAMQQIPQPSPPLFGGLCGRCAVAPGLDL